MNILIWATTFGSDLWSMARYITQNSDDQVTVILDDPAKFQQQGVNQILPLNIKYIKRKKYHYFSNLSSVNADITLMDNRTPFFKTSKKGFMLWHGFGWKGPNDEEELYWLHRSLKKLWGDPKLPNDNFRWQCFGEWDFEHRTKTSGFHPHNCRILGAASHDHLRVPLDRTLAQPFYPFDIVNRRTVLIAPTWHYGEVFAHWGSDAEMFDRLLSLLKKHNVNTILRLHDSYRFEKPYRDALESLCQKYDHVMLKYKDEAPDNYLDLHVSDVLITNYSSIANLYYSTLRPTVHIYPVRSADEEFIWRYYYMKRIKSKVIDRARYIWKLSPDEHGGLLARDFEQLLRQVNQALEDPDCCKQNAQAFLDKYMLGADGHSCERIWNEMKALVAL